MSKCQGKSSVVRVKQAAHCSNTDSLGGQKSRELRTAELATTGHTVTSNANEIGKLCNHSKWMLTMEIWGCINSTNIDKQLEQQPGSASWAGTRCTTLLRP